MDRLGGMGHVDSTQWYFSSLQHFQPLITLIYIFVHQKHWRHQYNDKKSEQDKYQKCILVPYFIHKAAPEVDYLTPNLLTRFVHRSPGKLKPPPNPARCLGSAVSPRPPNAFWRIYGSQNAPHGNILQPLRTCIISPPGLDIKNCSQLPSRRINRFRTSLNIQ